MINSKELISYTKNLSILFVEDHDELRENTTEILSNFFKIVLSARNGEEALSIYQDYHSENDVYIDIILSDLQMPIIDGVELTKLIYDINPSQTVIILSAYDEAKYLLPLINLGIEQFIKKPIDYQELLKVLLSASKKISLPALDTTVDLSTKIQLSSTSIFNKETSSLMDGSKNIYLTKYEIIFLQLLSTNIGKIYSNEDIVTNYISKNENIDAQNIRKLVSKLRKKLPLESIESIYGIGYKIIPFQG